MSKSYKIDLYKFVISECFMYIIKNYKFIPKNIITFTESIPFYTFRLDFICQKKKEEINYSRNSQKFS